MDENFSELKADVKELLQRSAVHNELLRTHEARSLALQESQKLLEGRIQPIEAHVKLLNAIGKILLAILTSCLVGVIVKTLLSHLG